MTRVPADPEAPDVVVVCPTTLNFGGLIAFLSNEQICFQRSGHFHTQNVATIFTCKTSRMAIVKSRAVLRYDNLPTHLSFLCGDHAPLVRESQGRVHNLTMRTATSKDAEGYDQTSLLLSVSMTAVNGAGQVCLAPADATSIRFGSGLCADMSISSTHQMRHHSLSRVAR
jgi:hypothetical protein